MAYISVAESMVYLHSIFFVVGSERRIFTGAECVSAVQGHPRSLILTPIERAYATFHWPSIVTLSPILPRFRDIAGFTEKSDPNPLPPQFLGCSPWTRLPRSEDPKLIIRVINFDLVQLQPICSRYINVTDGRTDGQTDGRLTVAIPRFALRASRGNKIVLVIQ